MRYMLLIWENEAASAARNADEQAAIFEEYRVFTQGLRDAGVFRAGDPLLPSETASTVRVRDGDRLTTDGPFAETREQLGGYYIVECETLKEACGYAAGIPTARDGAIEVRPVMDFDE